jgi:ankyrin repeat protein
MLEKGASVNEVIKTTGETPLLFAVSNQYEVTVELLLQYGALVDQRDHYQDTPLHMASQKGNVKILQVKRLFLPLFTLKCLLDKKPSCLNAVNRFSMTALASAVVHNHVPCVEVLVAAGADVNAKDDRNFSPIMIAAKNGYLESLLGNTFSTTADFAALLVPSAKLNEKSDDGYTALNEALINDHADCAKLLITKGASVIVADVDGVTPLHLSCHKGNTVLVKTLLRKGAKLDEVDGLGTTKLVKLLVTHVKAKLLYW